MPTPMPDLLAIALALPVLIILTAGFIATRSILRAASAEPVMPDEVKARVRDRLEPQVQEMVSGRREAREAWPWSVDGDPP